MDFSSQDCIRSSLDKKKLRVVAKGYNQTPCFDFSKTFSLMVKKVTIQIILTIVLSKKWKIHQLDINNTFLNGHLTK